MPDTILGPISRHYGRCSFPRPKTVLEKQPVVLPNKRTSLRTMATEILIEDFSNPTHTWEAMTGSHSTVVVEHGVADLQEEQGPDGESDLESPLVIGMETEGGVYPDISTCLGLLLKLKSSSEPLSYYHVSLGNHDYTADFQVPSADNEFGDIFVPFSDFGIKRDNDTENKMVTCAQDPKVCPTQDSLQNLERLSLGANNIGSGETVHLEIASIAGTQCAEEAMERREETSFASSKHHGGPSAAAWTIGSVAMVGFFALMALLGKKAARLLPKNSQYAAINKEEHDDETELTLQVWNRDSKLEMEELEWLEDNAE